MDTFDDHEPGMSDEDDPDLLVARAFETLLGIEDADWQEAVTNLLEATEESTDPMSRSATATAGRLRAIGSWSTTLMDTKIYQDDPACWGALDTILKNCLDDGPEYLVSGLVVDGDPRGKPTIRDLGIPVLVEIGGLSYVRDFEKEKPMLATFLDRKQPALEVILVGGNHEVLMMPLRHLKTWSEVGTTPESSQAFESCGDAIHDLSQLVELGKVAIPRYVLESIQIAHDCVEASYGSKIERYDR